MAKAAKIKYDSEGITIQGNLSVTGTSSFTGALSYVNLTLTGNLQVDGNSTLGNAAADTVRVKGTPQFDEQVTLVKNIIVGTGCSITAGGLQVVAGGVVVSANNLVMSAGDIVLDAGDVALTLGDVEVDAGDVTVTLGDLDVTAGSITAGTNITATATVQGADLVATDDLSVTDDAGIGGDLTVTGSASVGVNLGVTGTLTAGALVVAGLFTADDFTVTDDLQVGDDALVSGDLTVTGATVLNGNMDFGNAAGDTITMTGSVDSDLTFLTGAARAIIGPASNNLTITALANRALVLQSNNATQMTLDVAGGVTFANTANFDGVVTFSANPVFDIAGPCSLTATADQNMTIAATGAGHAILTASNSIITIENGAGGAIGINAGAGTATVTGNLAVTLALQPAAAIDFQTAGANTITAAAGQNLTIATTGAGDLILQTAGAVAAISIDGGTDTIAIGSAIDSDDLCDFAGEIRKSSAHGSYMAFGVLHNEVAALAGGATETVDLAAAGLPAGAQILGVAIRVTEEIAMAAGHTFNIGDGVDADLWGVGTLHDINTTASSCYAPANASTNLVLTGVGGNFTGGAGQGSFRWTVYYRSVVAPTA